MKHKRKLSVFLLSLLACLFLSACQPATTPSKETTQDSGSKDVKTYIRAMRNAKNMEYVSKIYRKNLLEVKGLQSLMYEPYDMGKFSLTLKYIMNFIRKMEEMDLRLTVIQTIFEALPIK